jgi:glutamine synthetase type III
LNFCIAHRPRCWSLGKAKKYNFNHREMHSRNEIALEQYILAIDVEDALTL